MSIDLLTPKSSQPALVPAVSPPLNARFNFAMLVGDVSSFLIGIAFLDISTTLPALVEKLGGGPVFLGIMLALRQAAYSLPPIFVAHRLIGRERYKPLLLKVCLGGRIWLFPAAFCLWRFGLSAPALALGVLAMAYTLSWMGDGAGGVPWTAIIGRAIPANQRGALFATSQVLSAVGRLIVGGIVLFLLGSGAVTFPINAALLTLGCALLLMLSFAFLAFIREPAPPESLPSDAEKFSAEVSPDNLAQFLRSLPSRLRDKPEFGRLAIALILANAAPASAPFIVAFAERETNAAPLLAHLPLAVRHLFQLLQTGGLPGLFLIVQTLGLILLAPIWGAITDRFGPKAALRGVFLIALVSPVCALLASHAPGPSATLLLFLIAYFCFGAIQDCWVTFTNFLLEIVPDGEQPTYIALMSLISTPVLILPVAAGLLAEHVGPAAAFLAAAALLLGGFWSVSSLPDTRKRG